jgi:hypothetical protein
MDVDLEGLRHIAITFGILSLLGLVVAVLMLILAYRRLRRLNLPAYADFFTTLRAVPLSLVLFLDFLDFSLDFFAAPVAWVVLGRLGLQGLRGVTVVEEVIPGTQLIPTMTAAWLLVRICDGLGVMPAEALWREHTPPAEDKRSPNQPR